MEGLRYKRRSVSGIFVELLLLAGGENNCKEGPVLKASCRPQEAWAKFLDCMTTCFSPLPVTSLYFVSVSVTFALFNLY